MLLPPRPTRTSPEAPGQLAKCVIWRDTEPVELPLLVTINEAMRVSPTWAGSPEITRPEPLEEVKLVELLEVLEFISGVLSARIPG